MIDFHSHILPNIDDGARNVEETFKLIKEAEEVGFDTIISTSHYIEGYYESNVAERETWIKAINEKLKERSQNITLHLGNEVYLSNNIKELIEEKKATTIKGTNYILFEMPLNTKPLNIFDVVYDMLQQKLRPILAHPERYSYVQKDPNLIYDLIEKGVLMQCNYGSIIGQYQDKARIIAKKLLENDMVHFLGSDVHRAGTVYKNIPRILNEIEKIVGKEKLEELTTINPKLVLENKSIEIDNPRKIELSLKEKIKIGFKK